MSVTSLAAMSHPRKNAGGESEPSVFTSPHDDVARFWAWLRTQVNRAGGLGELARDVSARPSNGPWSASIQAYLRHGDAHVRDAIEQAIDEFSYQPHLASPIDRNTTAGGRAAPVSTALSQLDSAILHAARAQRRIEAKRRHW